MDIKWGLFVEFLGCLLRIKFLKNDIGLLDDVGIYGKMFILFIFCMNKYE